MIDTTGVRPEDLGSYDIALHQLCGLLAKVVDEIGLDLDLRARPRVGDGVSDPVNLATPLRLVKGQTEPHHEPGEGN